jgi:hypothetical protein
MGISTGFITSNFNFRSGLFRFYADIDCRAEQKLSGRESVGVKVTVKGARHKGKNPKSNFQNPGFRIG